jgi:hypothetical protein
MNQLRLRRFCQLTALLILMAAPTISQAAYSASNYLIFKNSVGTYTGSDSTNYPATGMAGWGTAPPALGTTATWPSQYGGGAQRRADHTQLTGDNGNGAAPQSLIVYSRYTPVNTTGELVLVHGDNSTSCWVFNTKTNAPVGGAGGPPLRMKPSLGTSSRSLGEVNELRWDYTGTHPYRLYFVGISITNTYAVGTENVPTSFYYVEIDTVTGAQSNPVLIHDFSNNFPASGAYPTGGYVGAAIMNDVEGDSSHDSRYWAWQVVNNTLGSGTMTYAIVTYDKQTDTILGRLQSNCAGVPAPCTAAATPATPSPYFTRPNMVEISPLGTHVLVDSNRLFAGYGMDADIGGIDDAPHVFNLDFSGPFVVGADSTHSGWAWGPNGEELFVSQNNRNDYIEAVNIQSSTTAHCSPNFDGSAYNWSCGTKIAYYQSFDPTYNGIGFHFGRLYNRNIRGWAFMSTYDSGDGWGMNKELMLEIKDVTASAPTSLPRVWRISPSPNQYLGSDYRSEGSAALDFAGTELWISGNWGQNTAGKGEVYSMGMPANWYSALGGNAATTPRPPSGFRLR